MRASKALAARPLCRTDDWQSLIYLQFAFFSRHLSTLACQLCVSLASRESGRECLPSGGSGGLGSFMSCGAQQNESCADRAPKRVRRAAGSLLTQNARAAPRKCVLDSKTTRRASIAKTCPVAISLVQYSAPLIVMQLRNSSSRRSTSAAAAAQAAGSVAAVSLREPQEGRRRMRAACY